MKGEEAAEEMKKCVRLAEMGSWDWRKEAVSTREVQSRAASANAEAAASRTEDLAEITTEGGYTKQQVVNEMKQPCVRRCHPGL